MGVIEEERDKNGWYEATVHDLKSNADNALATGPFGSSIGSRFFQRSGVPVIRGGNLSTDGRTRLNEDGFVFISEVKAAEFRRSTARKGDLIFTCWGTINQVGLIDEKATYPRYVISNKQMKFTPDPEKADPVFLFYLFTGSELQRTIVDQSIGSSVPGFNLGQLKAMRFGVPDVEEQRAIGRALTDADELLTGLEQLIEKKRGVVAAATRALVNGDVRLPGFTGAWEVKLLSEIATARKGQTITEKTAVPGPIPVIAGGMAPSYSHNTANRPANTITVSASGANAGYVAFHPYPIFASDCSTIQESTAYDVRFLYFALLSRQNAIYSLQTGGAQPHVYPEHLHGLELATPRDVDEQRVIGAVLLDMNAEVSALERQRNKVAAVKQGMAQALLTGRARVIEEVVV